MKLVLTNFDCIECGQESPYGIMKIPFKCKCSHKGFWSTLPKNIFQGNEYPESLKEFYSIFHQPERSKREDSQEHDWISIPSGDGMDCRKCGATEKNANERCGALNTQVTE